MQWSDRGIVLSVRRLGENSGVIHFLTPAHGLCAGVDRGAFGSRKRGIYQPGNLVMANWNARLPEHLGMVSCELLEPTASHLMDDRRKLAALTSATLLTQKTLAEREAHPEIYDCMAALLKALCLDGDWLTEYVLLEYALLTSSGFGLDLERCASTGQAHDLIYVSPKSGRAVSREAGEPYRERLLKLPPFMRECTENIVVDMAQILDGLRLCGYFLVCRVFEPRGIAVPVARARFVNVLQPERVVFGEVTQ